MIHRRVPIIVLAGGASRRMGTDKRSVLVDGEPMLQRVIDRVTPHRVIVVVDPRRDTPPVASSGNVRFAHDLRPGEGPLAGLEAGLAAAEHDTVLVVVGDMPWLEPAILDLLITRLAADTPADLACLVVDGTRQPFPIACRRAPTLAAVTALLDRGERRMRAILDSLRVATVDEPGWRAIDPSGRSLRDIDTPADLAGIA